MGATEKFLLRLILLLYACTFVLTLVFLKNQYGGQNLGKLNFKKQYRSLERTKAVAFL